MTKMCLPPDGTAPVSVHVLVATGLGASIRCLWKDGEWWFPDPLARPHTPQEMAAVGWSYGNPVPDALAVEFRDMIATNSTRYTVRLVTKVTSRSDTGRVILHRVGPSATAPLQITFTGPYVFEDYTTGAHFEVIIRRALP